MSGYHYKNSPADGQRAKLLRKQAPMCERLLWNALSALHEETGIRFRRQHPLPPYFADFACVKARVVIEIDGASHDTGGAQAYDGHRDIELRKRGWLVIRYLNEDVQTNLEGVVLTILQHVRSRLPAHPQPLPRAGGGRKRRSRGLITEST